MSILERYIWKSVAFSILVTWASLVMLDTFFAFLDEIGDVNSQSNYGTFQALTYIAHTIPRRLYDYFPTATLIGALLGLGNMAANSELIAIRAAGLSIARIVWMTIKLGFVLALIAFSLGEWVAPTAENKGEAYKAEMLNKRKNTGSVWFKHNQQIIHIVRQVDKNTLHGVTIYKLDMHTGDLSYIRRARKAVLIEGEWQLHAVNTTYPSLKGVKRKQHKTVNTTNLLPNDLLSIASVEPEQLAASELAKVIEHQKGNELTSARFELAYWEHYTTPLSTIVMLILAAPFVFGTQRNAGAGQRIFVGIILGISFFLLNHIIGTSGIVYGLSPLFSATFPLLLFLVGGLVLLFRTR